MAIVKVHVARGAWGCRVDKHKSELTKESSDTALLLCCNAAILLQYCDTAVL